jgi:hypothetical protein
MKYFVLIICLFLFACKKTDNAVTESPEQTATIPINTCNAFTNNTNYSICFDSLISDSRCPIDPNILCVWAGVAIVKLSLTQNNSLITFKLSTAGGAHFPPKDTTINGVNIKLLDVQPYPKFIGSNNEIKKVILSIQ